MKVDVLPYHPYGRPTPTLQIDKTHARTFAITTMAGSSSSIICLEGSDTTFVKVEDLWFDDGSLIILAQDKGFCVYRGLLARKSGYFKDMVSFPGPASTGQETYNGCPVVRLTDSAQEVEAFLRAIVDAESFLLIHAKPRIEFVVAVLRLSHKYQVPYLRKRAIEHLLKTIPLSHKGLITRMKRYASDDETKSVLCRSVGVFREVEANWFLPFSFYLAATIFPFETVIKRKSPFGGESWADDDVVALQKVREMLCIQSARRAALYISDTFNQYPYQCGEHCYRARHAKFKDAMNHSNPNDLFSLTYDGTGICSWCYGRFPKLLDDFAERVWNELPKSIGIPQWDMLLKEKDEALKQK